MAGVWAVIELLIVMRLDAVADNAEISCLIDKMEIPVSPSRVILRFECYSGDGLNPSIPIDNGLSYFLFLLLNLINFGLIKAPTNGSIMNLTYRPIYTQVFR